MTAIAESEFRAYANRVEQMVEQVSAIADAAARNVALELLQSVMDLHGAAFARVVELLESDRAAMSKIGGDPLLCGMMVLYGVHPVPMAERVAKAVANVAPQLRKHGGTAEVVAIEEAVVRLKIESSGHGCGSSTDAIADVVRQAVLECAPEVVEVAIEGAAAAPSGFVPLNNIQPAVKETSYEESAA